MARAMDSLSSFGRSLRTVAHNITGWWPSGEFGQSYMERVELLSFLSILCIEEAISSASLSTFEYTRTAHHVWGDGESRDRGFSRAAVRSRAPSRFLDASR